MKTYFFTIFIGIFLPMNVFGQNPITDLPSDQDPLKKNKISPTGRLSKEVLEIIKEKGNPEISAERHDQLNLRLNKALLEVDRLEYNALSNKQDLDTCRVYQRKQGEEIQVLREKLIEAKPVIDMKNKLFRAESKVTNLEKARVALINEYQNSIQKAIKVNNLTQAETELKWLEGIVEDGHNKSEEKDLVKNIEAKIAQVALDISEIPKSFKTVFVKGGDYLMKQHTNLSKKQKEEKAIFVADFYMMSTEVTQQQWRWVMQQNPSHYKQCGDECPVESVSWTEVQDFIGKLNQLTGRNFRLPTEEEWEYAAYADNKPAVPQNTQAFVNEVGWNERNSNRRTHPVAQKKPNSIGLYDMVGNVSEWTSSPYLHSQRPMYYCRGGAAVFFNERSPVDQDKKGAVIGFRLCYSKEE